MVHICKTHNNENKKNMPFFTLYLRFNGVSGM